MFKILGTKNSNAILSLLIIAAILLTSFGFMPEASAIVAEPPVYGDVSGDGVVDSADYTLLRRYLLGIIHTMPAYNWKATGDVNLDDKIDAADYTIIRKYLLRMITTLPYKSDSPLTPTSSPAPTITLIPTSSPTPTTTILPTGVSLYTPNVDEVSINATDSPGGAMVEVTVTLPDDSYYVKDWGEVIVAMAGIVDPDTNSTHMSYRYLCNATIYKTTKPVSTNTPVVSKFTYYAKCSSADVNYFSFSANDKFVKGLNFKGGVNFSTPTTYIPNENDVSINVESTSTGANINVEVTLPDNSYSVTDWGRTFPGVALSITPVPHHSYIYYYNATIVKDIRPEAQIIKAPKIEKHTYTIECRPEDKNQISFAINSTILKNFSVQGGLTPSITSAPTPTATPCGEKWISFIPNPDQVSFELEKISPSEGIVHVKLTYPSGGYRTVSSGEVAVAAGILPDGSTYISNITEDVQLESYTGPAITVMTSETLSYDVGLGYLNKFVFKVGDKQIKYIEFDKDLKIVSSGDL